MQEDDGGKGLDTFWKSIFEISEGMDGIWVDDFGNPFRQKWRRGPVVSENGLKSSKTFYI